MLTVPTINGKLRAQVIWLSPMDSRSALTVQTQLALPMIPFAIDTLARWLFLRDAVAWYELPDLVTLLATFALFCLAVMFAINPYSLPTDEEAQTNVELARQRLLGTALISITLAGCFSFYKAFDQAFPKLGVSEKNGIYVFVISLMFVIYNTFRIMQKYISYVNKG